MVDAADLKSAVAKAAYGFESRPRHGLGCHPVSGLFVDLRAREGIAAAVSHTRGPTSVARNGAGSFKGLGSGGNCGACESG